MHPRPQLGTPVAHWLSGIGAGHTAASGPFALRMLASVSTSSISAGERRVLDQERAGSDLPHRLAPREVGEQPRFGVGQAEQLTGVVDLGGGLAVDDPGGDPSPAATVARAKALRPEAVRQTCKRLIDRVSRLAASDPHFAPLAGLQLLRRAG